MSSEDPGTSIKDEYLSDDTSTKNEDARELNSCNNDTDIDDGIIDFKMHEVDWENLEVKLKEAQIEMDNQVSFDNTLFY